MTDHLPLIVLRFRDIEVNPGGTILEHRRAIQSWGYCWWGWLFRDYENNPYAELDQIAAQMKSVSGDAPFPVLLYHTGQAKVFHAECLAIATSPTPTRSPQIDCTPDYYRDRRAPAWFKFSGIHDETEDTVIGRTCIALPSAAPNSYTDLLGKPVERLEDLRRQEVTLWVLA